MTKCTSIATDKLKDIQDNYHHFDPRTMDQSYMLLRLIQQLYMVMQDRTNRAMSWICMIEQCLNATTCDNRRLYTLLQRSEYGVEATDDAVLPPPGADPRVLQQHKMTVDCPSNGKTFGGLKPDWYEEDQRKFGQDDSTQGIEPRTSAA